MHPQLSRNLSRRDFLRRSALGAAGIAVLTACQPVGPGESSTGAPASAAPISISVWDYDPTGTDLWVQADQEFQDYFAETHPDIEVNRTVAPWTGFTEKFLTSVAGGAQFDVIYGWWRWLPQFMENNVVAPIDELLASETEVSPDDFYEYAKEIVDGKTYGLGWYAGADFVWYNRSKVADAGQADPKTLDQQDEWTADTFYQFAKAMTSELDGAPIYGFDMAFTRSLATYSTIASNWGTALWDEEFTQSTMDSEQNIQLWQYIQQFYQEGLSPTPGQGGGSDEMVGYSNERVIGFVTGNWYIRTAVQETIPDRFEIGMARHPKGPAGQNHVVYLNSYYWGSAVQNPDAAWTWYKERSFSEKANEIYLKIGNSRFPGRKSLPILLEFDWEDAEVYDAIRPLMVAYRVSPQEAKFEESFGAAWDEMVLEQRPVAEILGQLAQDATAQLNES